MLAGSIIIEIIVQLPQAERCYLVASGSLSYSLHVPPGMYKLVLQVQEVIFFLFEHQNLRNYMFLKSNIIWLMGKYFLNIYSVSLKLLTL